jgi:hypothetical protein
VRSSGAIAIVLSVAALAPPRAFAHDAAAVLDVVALGAEDYACDAGSNASRPLLLRTSIGLARALDDGRYEHFCPSAYGDAPFSSVAGSESGRVLASPSMQQAWVSVDNGCTWRSLALPAPDFFAYDVAMLGETPLFLARNATEAVLLAAPGDELDELARWNRSGEDGFTPDNLAAMADGRIVVSGARPATAMWIFAADLASSRRLVPVDAPASMQRLSVRRADADAIWVLETTDAGRALALIDPSTGARVATDAAGTVVHGPVRVGTDYFAIVDGQLLTVAPSDGATTPVGAVDWTCLDQVGDTAFACALYDLHELVDVGTAAPEARLAFTVTQLSAPSTACDGLRSDAALQACNDDWVHLGGENYLLDRGGATCPDGSGRIDDDGSADGSGGGTAESDPDGRGCAAARQQTAGATTCGLFLALFAARRRVRR